MALPSIQLLTEIFIQIIESTAATIPPHQKLFIISLNVKTSCPSTLPPVRLQPFSVLANGIGISRQTELLNSPSSSASLSHQNLITSHNFIRYSRPHETISFLCPQSPAICVCGVPSYLVPPIFYSKVD